MDEKGLSLISEADQAASLAEQELWGASSWDIAIRYHELKARYAWSPLLRRIREVSAQAVLERAREVLGSVVHVSREGTAPFEEVPESATHIEEDWDATLEESPLWVRALSQGKGAAPELWVSFRTRPQTPIVLSVDTSLSMTGEKLALTAVALAVVLLQFPESPVGIVAFENEARVLKSPRETITIEQLVERFLDVPAQGYTHLEEGLQAALRLIERAGTSTLLLTDGKYTAGRDPAYLAPRFDHLVVMKMGRDRASLSLCRELASRGHGAIKEIAELEGLPQAMYGVVKDLIRGRSRG